MEGIQWRRHGGGGKRGNLPPPQPPIGHPVRSMQIRGDFRVRKNGVGLQDLLRRFTCTDATADVLWSYDYEKEGVVAWVENFRNARGCFSTGGRSAESELMNYSCFTQI